MSKIAGLAGAALIAAFGAAPVLAASPASVADHKAKYTVDTKIGVLMADPKARVVMDKYMPHLAENPHYFMIRFMSIREAAKFTGGQLTPAHLAHIDTELAEIN